MHTEFDLRETGAKENQALGWPLLRAARKKLVQKVESQVHLFLRNRERWRQCEDVLVIAAHVEHQSVVATARFQGAANTLGENSIDEFAIRRNSVGFANFQAKRETKPSTWPMTPG